MIRFCDGQIAHYKAPEHVRIVDDLPMTVTGGPQKFVMHDRMVAHRAVEADPGSSPEGVETQASREIAYFDRARGGSYSAPMTKRKLPIGIQTFREIREEGCYYVDKTAGLCMASGISLYLSSARRSHVLSNSLPEDNPCSFSSSSFFAACSITSFSPCATKSLANPGSFQIFMSHSSGRLFLNCSII